MKFKAWDITKHQWIEPRRIAVNSEGDITLFTPDLKLHTQLPDGTVKIIYGDVDILDQIRAQG